MEDKTNQGKSAKGGKQKQTVHRRLTRSTGGAHGGEGEDIGSKTLMQTGMLCSI